MTAGDDISSAAPMPEPQAAAAFAPPTSPGRLAKPEQAAAWPGVVATICIIFGSLGTLGSLISLVWHILFASGLLDKFFEWVSSPGPGMNPAVAMKEHTALIIVSEVLKLALSVMLLAIGIGMLQRRPGCVPLAKAWSVVKIIFTLVGTAIGIWMQKQMLQGMMSGSNVPVNATPTMSLFMSSGAVLGGLLAVAWGCALPVFLLVWLHLRSVKIEIARWRPPAR